MVCKLDLSLASNLHQRQAITELESAITALHAEDPLKKNTSLKSKSDKEKSNTHKDVSSVFSKFKKCRFRSVSRTP